MYFFFNTKKSPPVPNIYHILFGTEELTDIGPAVEAAKAKGINAIGPCPADSVFNIGKSGKFDAILSLLLENEKGIELNTGGLKYGLKEANPCMGILRRYREMGGELITVGSDAHEPAHIAYSFEKAADMLKECGFSYYATFQNRLPEYHKL